jgi:hypothetical protein
MRQRKTIKIDDKEITVKELTVREIISIGDNVTNQIKEDSRDGINVLKDLLAVHFPLGFDNLNLDDLLDMAPSEIDKIYQAFREVNQVFFQVAKQAGLSDLLTGLKAAMQRDFSNLLAA